MDKFIKSFKLNLFSMLFFIFVFPFYIITFLKVPSNNGDAQKAQIFALLLFVPVLIVQIISIVASAKVKFLNIRPKILLIFMDILFVVGPIVMLGAKVYFDKFLDVNENDETDTKIYKNTIINSVYIFACILFGIIYTILDLTLSKSNQKAAEIFALLFVSSIAFIIYEYLLMLFIIVYAKNLTTKQKGICCIPIYNIIYYKKINNLNKEICKQK